MRSESRFEESDFVVVDVGLGLLVEMKRDEAEKWAGGMVEVLEERVGRERRKVEELEAAIVVVRRGLEAMQAG